LERAGTISGLTVRCFRNYRRPDGRCPAHANRPDTMAMLVSAAVGPLGRVSGYRRAGGHQDGHVVVPAAPRRNVATVRPDTGPEPLLPQATATSKAGRHGRCPAGLGDAHGRAERALSDHRHGQTLPRRPSGMPSRFRTPADTLPPPASPGGGGGYGNRSLGWRPLVGCSQRRWTRASRAVRRPRS
jgi:hypothetical protein